MVWFGLDWIGLVWIGMDWIGLDWFRSEVEESLSDIFVSFHGEEEGRRTRAPKGGGGGGGFSNFTNPRTHEDRCVSRPPPVVEWCSKARILLYGETVRHVESTCRES